MATDYVKYLNAEQLKVIIDKMRKDIAANRKEYEEQAAELNRLLNYLYVLEPNPVGGRH